MYNVAMKIKTKINFHIFDKIDLVLHVFLIPNGGMNVLIPQKVFL